MNKINQTDALGGEGSLTAGLKGVAVNGLSRLVDGYLSRKYPLTSLNENYTVEGGGAYEPYYGTRATPRSAPQPGARLGVPGLSPAVLAVGGVLVVGLVLLIAFKR